MESPIATTILAAGPQQEIEPTKESEMADGNRNDQQGGLPRDQDQDSIPAAGRQVGGGPSAPDRAAPGGSSGSGGYGQAQNQQFHQGQQERTLSGGRSDETLSRGERFDEQQGGGRDPASVSVEEDLERDRVDHQDRGQSVAEDEAGR